MKRTAFHPKGVAKPGGYFSHAIIAESGRTLYVAGQVSLDKDGNLVAPGDPEGQTRQVLQNLKQVIEEAGGKMDDVAKTTTYVTKLEYRTPVGNVRKEFFKGEPPANTLAVISSLAHPDFLIEIEAIVPLSS